MSSTPLSGPRAPRPSRFAAAAFSVVLLVGQAAPVLPFVAATRAVQPAAPALVDLVEPFNSDSVTSPGDWVTEHVAGSDPACLTALAATEDGVTTGSGTLEGCFITPDPIGHGALRLTSDKQDQGSSVIYTHPQLVASGLDIRFKVALYFGTGGDGLSFFLKDGANNNDVPGHSGASLGYGTFGGDAGVPAGLLGIGFDRFGNFSDAVIDGAGCDKAPGNAFSSLAIRGAGNGADGYCYLGGTEAAGIDYFGVDRLSAGRLVRIAVDPPSYEDPKIRVYMSRATEQLPEVPILVVDEPAEFAIADTFKFGFAASTGGYTTIAEIWDLGIDPLTDIVTTPGTVAAPSNAMTFGTTPPSPLLAAPSVYLSGHPDRPFIADVAPTCGITDPVTGDPVTITSTTPVGVYPVVCTGGYDEYHPLTTYLPGTFTVRKAAPVLTYTGDRGAMNGGVAVTLSSTLSIGACDTEPIAYTSNGSPVSSGFLTPMSGGALAIVASYPGNANCDPSSDGATITINTPGTVVAPSGTMIFGSAPPSPVLPAATGYVSAAPAEPIAFSTAPTCTIYNPMLNLPLTVTSSTPVGTYPVRCAGGVSPYHTLATYLPGTFAITKASPILTYTGTAGVVAGGTSVTLSSSLSISACNAALVTYTINGVPATMPYLTPTGGGILEVAAFYPGNANCYPAFDSDVIVVAGPNGNGLTTTGGGIYRVDPSISGNPRINFGHTVQTNSTTDKKTGYVTTTVRGQLLWINTNSWRLKGSVSSTTVRDANGVYVSGDRAPLLASFACPATVGVSGSNPKCGAFTGTGVLQKYDSLTGTWKTATWLGSAGAVTFTVTLYDGGSVSTCKNKTCTITNVADYFGLAINGVRTTDGVPVTAPTVLAKSQNGQVVIR